MESQFWMSSVNVINMHDLQKVTELHIFCLFWHDNFDELKGVLSRQRNCLKLGNTKLCVETFV